MAIEYPKIYSNEPNWFEHKAFVNVQERLSISIPEFIPEQDKESALYLLPPNSLSRIRTNKQTRLRLGYSM